MKLGELKFVILKLTGGGFIFPFKASSNESWDTMDDTHKVNDQHLYFNGPYITKP